MHMHARNIYHKCKNIHCALGERPYTRWYMKENSAHIPTVGLFGIGLDTYWAQFPGLRERLLSYQAETAALLEGAGAMVVDAGLVDTVDKARAAGALFREKKVSLVFLYITTYALSQTVLPVAREAGAPMVIINVQPAKNIDYEWFNSLGDRALMTGEWLANCQSCCVPEIANVFNRNGIPYHIITGYRGEPFVEAELAQWVRAARVAEALRKTNIGILGHYYEGMLDVYTDVTRMAGVFGSQFNLIEMDYLAQLREKVSPTQIEAKIAQFRSEFEVVFECEESELVRAARTSCALDALVEEKIPWRPRLLLRRNRRQCPSRHCHFSYCGKHPPHRPPCSRRRRMRSQKCSRHENYGPFGCRRLVLGILPYRLRRRCGSLGT
jgi:hypothetical protein